LGEYFILKSCLWFFSPENVVLLPRNPGREERWRELVNFPGYTLQIKIKKYFILENSDP
jgi:hypothetical protein